MVSVNTNAAALTALRNLQATSQNLEMVQNRISTGLRIGEAKDNAAYWAISTTLKSDNKSLSTVKDALGLGSATVDVAYQGLTKAKDVLDEIKAKLTAATQSGVDRNVIQAEIKELQNQLKSIANSSVFSGENWLSVNSDTSDYSSIKKVVASFARASDNSVSIGTVNIDISNVALFDSSTVLGRDGLLDGRMSLKDATGRDLTIGGAITATGNGVTGGLPTANTSVAGTVSGTAPTQTTNTTPFVAGAVTGSGLAASDKISFDLVIDGKALTVQVAADNGTGAVSINTIHDALAANAMFASVATTTVNGSNLEILTRNSSGSTLLKSVTFTDSAGKVKIPTTTGFTNVAQPATISVAAGSFQAFALDKDDSIVFDIALNDATGTKTVKIDQALVNRALSTPSTPVTNGTVSSMANYQKVIAAAMTAANVANANVTVDSGGNLVIATNDVAGTKAAIAISNVVASGGGRQVSVVEIDISDANMLATGADTGDKIKQVLSAYISLVNAAIGKVTTAASNLGSVASRIDMQKSFVNTLMDTIEKGVSNLVDADMSEESTKLQALQVKQQLGSQALSIANQSANNVLQLFRTLQ